MTLDIDRLMKSLSKQRPIFHSEADFQHALAWRIHETMPGCQVRLEYPFPHEEKRMHLDIWIPTEGVAIELKYFTTRLELDCDSEPFALKDQAASDLARSGFLDDVQRLERVVKDREQPGRAGFAILLTNARSLWEYPRRLNARRTNDANFLLYEGREVNGKLAWQRQGRPVDENSIHLSGCYRMRWRDYSDFPGEKYGKFRYLSVSVQ